MSISHSDPESSPSMKRAAIWYAKRGWHIFPVHTPLFDEHGAVTGCTCETYRTSDECRDNHPHLYLGPDGKCARPGKCPRVRWKDRATNDVELVAHWWSKWPQANIGWVPGRDGFAVLDADTYKDAFDGAEMLTRGEQETITQISGGGGEHLVYRKHDGATYANAAGDLPAGIDVRADNGYIVIAPSLHESGNRYQWETGYGPHELEALQLPQRIHDQLVRATRAAATGRFAGREAWTTSKPDVKRLGLAKWLVEAIHAPAEVGERSEYDARVVSALCHAGVDDETILGIFEHYPIGIEGKFAERGLDYLDRTIANMRAHIAQTQETIGAVRMWMLQTTFADLVPETFLTRIYDRDAAGDYVLDDAGERILLRTEYRTDETDRAVADAVLDIMQRRNSLTVTVGKRQLGKLAGVGANTAVRALARLDGWLYEVTPGSGGTVVNLIANGPISRRWTTYNTIGSVNTEQCVGGGPSTRNGFSTRENEYSPRKGDDPYLTGVSRYQRRFMQRAAAAGAVDEYVSAEDAGEAVRVAFDLLTHRSIGKTGLRILDALLRCGPMTTAEIADETGRKQSGIYRAAKHLHDLGLVTREKPEQRAAYIYEVDPDVWQHVEKLRPHLRTHMLGAERENKRLRDAQLYMQERAERTQDPEERRQLERRIERKGAQRVPLVSQILADEQLPQPVIKDIAYNPRRPAVPHPAVMARLERQRKQDEHERAAHSVVLNIMRLAGRGEPEEIWPVFLDEWGFTETEIADGLHQWHTSENPYADVTPAAVYDQAVMI